MIKKQHLKRKHFTIVELLVAISIIAVLAGMLVGGLGGAQEQGSKAATKADILKLEMAIEQYKRDNGAYPWATTNFSDLNSSLSNPTVAELLKYESFTVNGSGEAIDAWENVIRYIPSTAYTNTLGIQIFDNVHYNPTSFQLISIGPSGPDDPTNTNTSDDIYNFDKKK
jgi:type II secretory pathway pseudopilin PulG